MAEPYLVSFKPLSNYYFGSSTSFSEGFNAESRIFPTQLTLLGCIRRTILKKNNLLDDNLKYPKKSPNKEGKTYEEFTGKSTKLNLNDYEPDLGLIRKISPVFIIQWGSSLVPCFNDFLFPVPGNVYIHSKKSPGDKEIRTFYVTKISNENNNALSFVNNTKKNSVFLSNVNPKDSPAGYLGGRLFWESYLSGETPVYYANYLKNKIIINSSQMGIAREDRKTKDNAFYRKHDFKLEKKYSFGIIIHLENDILKNDDVILGGERSKFRMTVIKLKDSNSIVINNHPIIKRFLEINDFGDLYSDNDNNSEKLIKTVLISSFISDSKPKGIIHSIINDREIIRFMKSAGSKTDAFNFIPEGSVLYFNKTVSFNKESYKLAKIVGYNFALTINTKGDKNE